MLCDAGPLVAIIDRSDKNHQRCIAVLSSLRAALVVTWPCFTEAMYLLGRYGAHPAQEELWSYLEDGVIMLHISSALEQTRMRLLMRKYHDTPMDLADASLVAAAEALNEPRVFTTDADFFVYRINDSARFEVLP
jgi:hypothetical protein